MLRRHKDDKRVMLDLCLEDNLTTLFTFQAINCLLLWAVLMNRHKLAKTLWNWCDEPIVIGLVCSRMYREMSRYHMEQYQKQELEEHSKYVRF